MKNFTSADDCSKPLDLVEQTIRLKQETDEVSTPKWNKTLGLVFFNPSLRTRLSTCKAAYNLGMDVVVLNVTGDAWNIEFEDGTVMDGNTQEHIKDAVKVISGYCDLLGVRTFAELKDPEKDYSEPVLNAFLEYADIPIISLESATLHPLQSLADLTTIYEPQIKKPKVTVSWAPHPKALPQAVTNSFLQWIAHTDADVTLTHPAGYELSDKFTDGITITDNQDEALAEADFVYIKNWSSFSHYGGHPEVTENWTITSEKMALTNNGRFMHCLPIRRNVVASDTVIDESLIYQQAKNREYAAQCVLQNLLEANYG